MSSLCSSNYFFNCLALTFICLMQSPEILSKHIVRVALDLCQVFPPRMVHSIDAFFFWKYFLAIALLPNRGLVFELNVADLYCSICLKCCSYIYIDVLYMSIYYVFIFCLYILIFLPSIWSHSVAGSACSHARAFLTSFSCTFPLSLSFSSASVDQAP